jgi:uncharacterized membrane protein YdbT with pleckstrin-like domain
VILRVLAAPSEPPEAPLGSPGSVQVFRASPRFLTIQLLRVGVVALITLAPEAFGMFLSLSVGSEAGAVALAVVLVIALVFTTLHYFLVRLDYDMRYYVVTDRSLRIREGALVIRESTFTFANVQNVSVEQGPIARMLGIASVRIETAGGGGGTKEAQQGFGGHRGVLAGIDNANEVRDQILHLLKAYRDAGLGDREDEKHRAQKAGFSPTAIQRLREIRDELRLLRAG